MYTFHCLEKIVVKKYSAPIDNPILSYRMDMKKKKKKINEERERTKIKKIVNKFRWSIYEEKSRKSMCVKNDDRI